MKVPDFVTPAPLLYGMPKVVTFLTLLLSAFVLILAVSMKSYLLLVLPFIVFGASYMLFRGDVDATSYVLLNIAFYLRKTPARLSQ